MVGISACREPSVLDSLNTSSAPGLLDRYCSVFSVLLTILYYSVPERVLPVWAVVSPPRPAPSARSPRPTRRPRPTMPWCPTLTRPSSPADSSAKPWSTCLVGRPVESPAGKTYCLPTNHAPHATSFTAAVDFCIFVCDRIDIKNLSLTDNIQFGECNSNF